MATNAANIMNAVYLSTRLSPDAAIERALNAAGFEIQHIKTITTTLEIIKSLQANPSNAVLLVAEVQSGAIPLLMLLEEQTLDVPPSLLLDLTGDDIRLPVQALQYDVEEYLLASDPDIHREARARVLAERVIMNHRPVAAAVYPSIGALNGYAPVPVYVNGNGHAAHTTHIEPLEAPSDLQWDSVAHVIRTGSAQLRLSPIQARIFDRLWTHRNSTVTMKELVAAVLLRSDMDVEEGVRLLRPHLVRLRSKLESCPDLAHRIINVRGNGYMMI